MKTPLFLPIVFMAMMLPAISQAQYSNQNSEYAKNELSLSEGIITVEEINGWAGKGGASSFISQPSSLTGASFLTYRRFITRRFAIGATIGLDNEGGDLSYGNPEQSATGYDGVSGHYTVQSYTFAVEALFAYIRTQRFMFYGYAGMGPTFYKQTYYFYPNAPYAPPVTFPTNPYDYHSIYYNAQVTPVGIRFGGNVAGFVEFGFGYKGLFNGGLTVRF